MQDQLEEPTCTCNLKLIVACIASAEGKGKKRMYMWNSSINIGIRGFKNMLSRSWKLKSKRSFMRAEGPSLLGGLGACSLIKYCNLDVLKHHFCAF